jgi:hypothetical protein
MGSTRIPKREHVRAMSEALCAAVRQKIKWLHPERKVLWVGSVHLVNFLPHRSVFRPPISPHALTTPTLNFRTPLRPRLRHRSLVGAVASIALLCAACGSSNNTSNTAKLNVVPVQVSIAASILKERGVKTVVSCPAGVPLQAGYKFVCQASVDVGSYPVNVDELNTRGGVSYSNSTPLRLLSSHTIEIAIAQAILVKKHLTAKVKCPASILQEKGLVFACTATTKDGASPFRVTEVDSSGHVTFAGP